jgi:hypothetical protein
LQRLKLPISSVDGTDIFARATLPVGYFARIYSPANGTTFGLDTGPSANGPWTFSGYVFKNARIDNMRVVCELKGSSDAIIPNGQYKMTV